MECLSFGGFPQGHSLQAVGGLGLRFLQTLPTIFKRPPFALLPFTHLLRVSRGPPLGVSSHAFGLFSLRQDEIQERVILVVLRPIGGFPLLAPFKMILGVNLTRIDLVMHGNHRDIPDVLAKGIQVLMNIERNVLNGVDLCLVIQGKCLVGNGLILISIFSWILSLRVCHVKEWFFSWLFECIQ